MTPIHGRKSTFKYTPGTEVLFDCDPDFVLVGERRRVCESSGRWNIPGSGVDDRRTESEWKNWAPTKATRCIGEDFLCFFFLFSFLRLAFLVSIRGVKISHSNCLLPFNKLGTRHQVY